MLNTTSWATGFRQVLAVPGKDFIYGLVDSASIVTIDMSAVVDDEYGISRTLPGFLAAPRGAERDQGVISMSSVGRVRCCCIRTGADCSSPTSTGTASPSTIRRWALTA